MPNFIPKTGDLVILAVHNLMSGSSVTIEDPTAVIIYESSGNALRVIRTWFAGNVLPQLKYRIELGQATSLGMSCHQTPPRREDFSPEQLQAWRAECSALFDSAIHSQAYNIYDNLFTADLSGISWKTLESPLVFTLHVRPQSAPELPPERISTWVFKRKITTEPSSVP
jgi:hypothetical protein